MDIDKMLSEIYENSAKCIQSIKRNQVLTYINERLKISMINSYDEGAKKMRMISNDDLEMIDEIMKNNEDEIKRMNPKININGLEKVMTMKKKMYEFSDGQRREISIKTILDCPESVLNMNMIDTDSRNINHEIEINFRLKYLDEIMKYMNNEYDIWKLNGVEFDEFCKELIEMKIPFRMDILNRIYSNFTEFGNRWKNRCLIVNGYEYNLIFDCVKMKLKDLQYNEMFGWIECRKIIQTKISLSAINAGKYDKKDSSDVEKHKYDYDFNSDDGVIYEYHSDNNSEDEQDSGYDSCNSFDDEYDSGYDSYSCSEDEHDSGYDSYSCSEYEHDSNNEDSVEKDNKIRRQYIYTLDILNDFLYYIKNPAQYTKNESLTFQIIKRILKLISIDIRNSIVHNYMAHYTSSICFGSQLLKNSDHDKCLKEWLGCDYKWILFHRITESGHKESIRKSCEKRGPTLIIQRDFQRNIIGQFYIQSWSAIKEYMNVYEPKEIMLEYFNEEEYQQQIDKTQNRYEVYTVEFSKDFVYTTSKYPDIICEYVETKDISEESLKQFDDDIELLNDLNLIHLNDSKFRLKISSYFFKNPSEFLPNTHIIGKKYDSYLREWVGNYKWQLLYRASEHKYSSKSFHNHCDCVYGPLLIVIKSTGGWIFGGYFYQNSEKGYYNHYSKTFIFTLKNPHGVEPTRFYSKEEINTSYLFYRGSSFQDITINDYGNEEYSCCIDNNGRGGCECHPKYKSSLFVNTAGPNDINFFALLDYEVYSIQYDNKFTIDHMCHYPDIIWKYIETKEISDELMKQVDNEIELFNDLNMIHFRDYNFRVRISNFFFANPSKYLPNSHLVSQEYDDYLKEWLGSDCKWKLLYRASDNNFDVKPFHECCDKKGPTLVIIKSTEGWIFGGHRTQSWSSYRHIYDSETFIFTLKNPHGVEPTRFISKKEKEPTLYFFDSGPRFSNDIIVKSYDLGNQSSIDNDGREGYECHPQYKSSLFVNTSKPNYTNYFTTLDYEVFGIDNENNISQLDKQTDNIYDTTHINKQAKRHFNKGKLMSDELNTIPIHKSNNRIKSCPSKCFDDTQIIDAQYNSYIKKWIGDFNWKLIYRASKYDFSGIDFHKYCDDQGPTLIVVKSSGGWIFGGYTTQSWSGNGCKNDSKAFIFTLKNPHGVPPTRYLKKKKIKYAITCDPKSGPIFGDYDMRICDGSKDNSWIMNDSTYELDPKYKMSLFVNTDGPDKWNNFSVLDYEVFTHY